MSSKKYPNFPVLGIITIMASQTYIPWHNGFWHKMFYQTKNGGKSTVTHTQRHDEVIVQGSETSLLQCWSSLPSCKCLMSACIRVRYRTTRKIIDLRKYKEHAIIWYTKMYQPNAWVFGATWETYLGNYDRATGNFNVTSKSGTKNSSSTWKKMVHVIQSDLCWTVKSTVKKPSN